ncbi:MAG: hypothetical protein ACRCYL_03440, partial [Kluyvera sp.]
SSLFLSHAVRVGGGGEALLVIDMQGFVTDRIARGIDFYPDHCIENMRSVIALFRAAGKPIFHVRHETP